MASVGLLDYLPWVVLVADFNRVLDVANIITTANTNHLIYVRPMFLGAYSVFASLIFTTTLRGRLHI